MTILVPRNKNIDTIIMRKTISWDGRYDFRKYLIWRRSYEYSFSQKKRKGFREMYKEVINLAETIW